MPIEIVADAKSPYAGRMVEDVKTFREATITLKGFAGQLGQHTKMLAGAITIGVAATGFLLWQINSLARDVGSIEARTTSIEIKAASIEDKIDRLNSEFATFRAETNASLGQIKEALNVPRQSGETLRPSPMSFDGWFGTQVPVPVSQDGSAEGKEIDHPVWIYAPDPAILDLLEEKVRE